MNDSMHDSTTPQASQQKLITLASWLARVYDASDAPHPNTVRRWVRNKLIKPAPQKQGREYFFSPEARYDARGTSTEMPQ